MYDEKLFFGYVNVTEGLDGNTSEWQLRAYDSNTGSISVVPDINMRWGGNEPTVFDERLFLGALDLENGQELWVYSALSEQSRLVEDINPGYYHSNPKNFVDYDGQLFFSANSAPFADRELWAFEPFTESVTRVSDIRLGTASSDPDYLTLYDDRLFFVATSSTTGRELWVYDATTDEASIVADLLPGAFSSDPKYLIRSEVPHCSRQRSVLRSRG